MMRFVRYLFVQVFAYCVDMGGFMFLVTQYEVDPIVANLVGKVLAGLFAFIAHHRFTFGVTETGGTSQQAVRYFILLSLNIPISALVLSAMLWVISMAVIAKFVADVIGVALTYWLSKRFVFLSNDTKASTDADVRSKQ